MRARQPDVTDVPECLACGACCFSTLPEYIRVWGNDHERLGDHAERVTHFLGNQCYMRVEDGRCAALVIDPRARRFVCSVYEVRPDACRGLERGSYACRGERHEKADRPLVAVEALLRRARGEGQGEGESEGESEGGGGAQRRSS